MNTSKQPSESNDNTKAKRLLKLIAFCSLLILLGLLAHNERMKFLLSKWEATYHVRGLNSAVEQYRLKHKVGDPINLEDLRREGPINQSNITASFQFNLYMATKLPKVGEPFAIARGSSFWFGEWQVPEQWNPNWEVVKENSLEAGVLLSPAGKK